MIYIYLYIYINNNNNNDKIYYTYITYMICFYIQLHKFMKLYI